MAHNLDPRPGSQSTNREALTRTLAALAAHRQDGILQAVAMSARDLLRTSDLGQSLSAVIERIGNATGVDRAHIFEVDATTPDGRIVHHHMWSAPEAPVLPLQARATGTSMAQVGLGSWVPRLGSGEVIVGHVVQFEEPVRGLFEQLGTQSILVVPIFVDGKWWGDIGLDDCHSRRDWSPPEIDTVKTLAELVGAAVARARRITKLADASHIIENSPTILYRLSPREPYQLIFVSQNVRRYGYEADELLASPVRWLQHIRSDFHPAIAADIKSIVDRKVDYTFREFSLIKPNGSHVWFEGRGYPLRDDDGQLVAIEGILTDITERKQSEDALRESEEKFRSIFGSVNDGIFISDTSTGRFVDINEPGCSMFGFAHDELVGRDITSLSSGVPPYTQSATLEWLEKVRTSGPQRFEWHCKAKDGHLFWAEVSVRCAAFGGRDFVLATLRDISDRKQIEANILQMARYDGLTSLANRRIFVEAIQYEIARARRGERGFAVLYLDLDHFKDINDTLGHPIGDLLLKAVAERLQANVRRTDMVARFGGDEFAVIIVDLTEPEEAALLSSQLLKALSDPFSIQGNEIRSGTSIGIALYGPDSADAETLLAHADVALYRAKSEGRGDYRFFTDAMDAEVRTRVALDAELREAIAAHQLFLLYQPQVEIESGRIVGLEALVRWRHPRRGIVAPGEFIQAAEKSGLIVPLGRWVLREACRQFKVWMDEGIAPDVIAVNVSALQFKTPLELERDIAAALATSDLPPQRLELELTETVLMDASREHGDVLQRLRDQGVKIAIDDFGTGYSSLDYLRHFPVDRIKIAQEFVVDLGTTPGNTAIVKAALGLARELGLGVIAEGVETQQQLSLLKDWGCLEVQGYYFAKPLPAEEISLLLRRGTISPHEQVAAHA